MNKQEKLKMADLKEKGYSYTAIGSLFGISRQRAHQIISGYGILVNSLSRDGWYADLKASVVDRDKVCQKCGINGTLIVHHIDGDDNNNVLSNLIALCQPCHVALHMTGRYCIHKCSICKSPIPWTQRKGNYCEKCWGIEKQARHDLCYPQYTCEVCGGAFRRSRIRRTGARWCSNACQGKWLGENNRRIFTKPIEVEK